jgi:hypothetical protein
MRITAVCGETAGLGACSMPSFTGTCGAVAVPFGGSGVASEGSKKAKKRDRKVCLGQLDAAPPAFCSGRPVVVSAKQFG